MTNNQTSLNSLLAVLKEVDEVLDLMDSEGVRARNIVDNRCDDIVEQICESVGYGAVMDSAARQWFKKDSLGSFVSGPCAGTIRNLKAQVKAELKKFE